MSNGPQKMKLRTAQRLAGILLAHFSPFCERIEVAGSVRRRKQEVGDIELVAIPKMGSRPIRGQIALFDDAVAATEPYSLLDEALDELIASRHIMRSVPPGWESRPAWGERMKKFWTYGLPGQIVQVDLFIATPDNWGEIFTIRTGSFEFSKAFVTHLKHKTPYRQQDGALIIEATGELIAVPEERDYFRLAGLEWIEPKERTGAEAVRPVETGLSGNGYQIDTPSPLATQVVNIRDLPQGWQDDPQYVYIGRANPSYHLAESPFHNPFKISKNEQRGATLVRFEAYLRANPDLLTRARHELLGKTLVCWCAPQPCHGDVLARLIAEDGVSGNGYQITPAPQTKPVKALTLHQPWASLIAAGLKQYETRDWATGYRGPLAIHAGKTAGPLDLNAVLTPAERAKLPALPPRGAIVCLARLVDIAKSEEITADPEFASSREAKLGNFGPRRYGWRLEVVKVFDPPIPARGAQGLWNWAMPVETRAGINP